MADAENRPDKEKDALPSCGLCPIDFTERYCRVEKGKGPPSCPSLRFKKQAAELRQESPAEENAFARQAALQECEGYLNREAGYAHVRPGKTRIVEIVEFARRMGYKRLGLLFCVGSRQEGRIVHEILKTNGFEVASVMCKAGKLPKSSYGLTREQQVDTRHPDETCCNPAFQADMMNRAEVDFNILLNLCVGHDSLAIKHLKAPTTVLSVKDRVTGHNPLAAIYMYDTYYRFLKSPLPE